jgi:predicted choloylglycine hydrolase
MMARFLFLFCAFLFFGITHLNAQTTSEKYYFVVIDVFQKLEDAEKLTDEANLKGFNAQYALHKKKNKYYVYLLQTSDQKKAKSFLDQIRKETEYKNAWLYKQKLRGDQL